MASTPAPATLTSASSSSTKLPPANVNTADDEKVAKANLKLNSSAPTTTLQIRLADGSRLAAQFNLNHTVADIHSYIQT